MKPRILDLFCGAGGCSAGYHHAGFDPTGVDIKWQPNYPFVGFEQCDALAYLSEWLHDPFPRFDAIHASPPCQFRTAYKRRPGHVAESPNLIPDLRELLKETGLPYVIENVEGARDQLIDPITLCGSSFGLDVRRHRLFETSFHITGIPCDHDWQTPRFPAATNRKPNSRRTVEIGVYRIPLDVQQEAMGIDWMTLPELSQAIPPAYTEFIGTHLLAEINRKAAA